MRRRTHRKRQVTNKPPVVTNTTPLITLAGIGLLELLPLLYGEIWAPRIVMDERKARRIAAHLGLPVAGPLAVWLRAKQQGVITAVRPYILQMQSQGRRFHPDLLTRFLKEADE